MVPIVKWTLWQRRWSIFWWSLGVVGLVVLTLAFYQAVKTQADQLEKSFSSLSGNTLALFGGTDFFSPVGYLNSQLIYLMLPLLLIILAIGLGGSLVGREEHDLTIESLLARPVSRGRLLAGKAVAGILVVVTVTVIGSLATVLMVKAVGLAVPLGNVAAACFACLMLVLTFGSVAFLLAATGRGRSAALGVSAIYALVGYIIGSLAGTVHWLNKPSLVFPYHYYRSADILRGTFTWSSIIFYVTLTISCGLLAWLSFRRRDIS